MKTAEQLDRERAEWVRKAAAERESRKPMSHSAPVSGSILGLTAPLNEPEPYATEPAEPVAAEIDEEVETPRNEVVEEEVPVQRSSGSFLHFDEPAESHGDVSGPSFLGLGTSDSPEYLLEDETPSHARRNLLLLVFAVVVVLGALEWRASSHGESTNPVDVLHLKLPKKKGQGDVVVMPPGAGGATSSSASNAAPNDTSDNSKPDLVAEPNQPAMQPTKPADSATPPSTSTDTPAPAETSAPPPASTPPATGLNDGIPANKGGKPASTIASDSTTITTPGSKPSNPEEPGVGVSTPPTKPAANAATKPSTPATVAAKPAGTTPKPTAETRKPVTTASAATKPAAGRPSTKGDIEPETAPDTSLTAGSVELQKGIAAGATAMGRTWLWRAMSKGNGEAPVLLADMYAQGRGVTKDCEQAVLLLKAAAKKPNPHARSKLGAMYASGECVPQDRVQAYRWVHEALQVNPGSEWLERNQESIWKQMSAAERSRASVYR